MRRRGAPRQRRYRRLTVRVLVEYACDGELRVDPATTLGAGGLFITTEMPLAEGTGLKLRFQLPQLPDPWSIEGRVVWAHGPEAGGDHTCGMGIEFTDKHAVARLARVLDQL